MRVMARERVLYFYVAPYSLAVFLYSLLYVPTPFIPLARPSSYSLVLSIRAGAIAHGWTNANLPLYI